MQSLEACIKLVRERWHWRTMHDVLLDHDRDSAFKQVLRSFNVLLDARKHGYYDKAKPRDYHSTQRHHRGWVYHSRLGQPPLTFTS